MKRLGSLLTAVALGAAVFGAGCTNTPATPITPANTTALTPTVTSPANATTAPPVPTTGSSSSNDPAVPFHLKLIAEGLTSPVALVTADGSGRLFVADQIGVIRVIGADGALLTSPFLDLREKMVSLNPGYDERGLLGLAFHPAFAQNGRFFVYYSAPLRRDGPAGWNHTSHVSEYHADPGSSVADADSERIILQIDQPQSNHNGGTVDFGPDGFFYIATGDGGAGNDVGAGHSPGGNGQDTTNLLGKILRIDVNGAQPYAIPADNPDLGPDSRREIFAFGFRNPFRFSFDAAGGRELFAGDAGQSRWEEVSLVAKGGNYGWPLKEGTHGFNQSSPGQPPQQAPTVDAKGRPLVDPIIEYPNAANPAGGLGMAVVAGQVYRGSAAPGLQGSFIFGDYSSGGANANARLFLASRPVTGGLWNMKEVPAQSPDGAAQRFFLRSFGQDSANEVYVLGTNTPGPSGATGKIFKIVP